jgi:hypothetical protein
VKEDAVRRGKERPMNLPAVLRNRHTYAFTEVSAALLNLPASERAEAPLVYEVREK